MDWDVTEVKPMGNRTLAVTFASGLTGTIRLDPSYCTGVFSALLDDELLERATVQHENNRGQTTVFRNARYPI